MESITLPSLKEAGSWIIKQKPAYHTSTHYNISYVRFSPLSSHCGEWNWYEFQHNMLHTKCLPNHTKCLSNYTKCLSNHTKCITNHIKCLPNHTKCLSNHTKCLSNHTKWLSNHTKCLSNHTKCLPNHSTCPALKTRPLKTSRQQKDGHTGEWSAGQADKHDWFYSSTWYWYGQRKQIISDNPIDCRN